MSDGLILYVDDERANRVVFEQAFQSKFQVRTVSSGEEALAVLQDGEVAVLVTDQRMPGISGHELLERCRDLYPDVVRVVVTAYSDLDPLLRAVNDGLVSRYIVKPWDRAELEQVLVSSLENARLSRRGSALQIRLMQTERTVTLGSIAHVVADALEAPLGKLRGIADPPPEVTEALTATQRVLDRLRQFHQPAPRAPEATLDPLPVVRYAVSVCQHMAARLGGKILYDGPPHLPSIKIGGTELAQVLINLVSNAEHALQPGSGRVLVSVSANADQLRFTIADNGSGMAAEIKEQAGSAFFSTRPQGVGLGLAQCHRLLEGAGSKLELESVPGQGTTARFAVGLAPRAREPA